jgi:hypothetical protein
MRRVSRYHLLAGAVLVASAACASAPPVSSPTVVSDPQGVITSDARGRQITIGHGGIVADSVGTTPDSAFRALVRAYGELGLATPLLDLSARRVGNPRMTAMRSLKGSPLSRFLSCGEGITGPRANNDRIMLSIVSEAKPHAGGGTVLETRVTAVAIDTGGRGGQAQCTTTGELEELIHQTARTTLTP